MSRYGFSRFCIDECGAIGMHMSRISSVASTFRDGIEINVGTVVNLLALNLNYS